MSLPEPEKIPLLFPDPVIERYMQKVDRAAIRQRLKMTPEQRLEALQREVNARAAQQPMRVREEWPNEPAAAMRFYGEEFQPRPSTVPMLFPDPVIEIYMKEVDRTLIREQLKKDPTGRLQSLIEMACFWDEARKGRVGKQDGSKGD
jgi:hypothetical protein